MTYVRLSPEEQREVCEDLLDIVRAGMLPRLVAVRLSMLRERLTPGHWDWVAIDDVTKRASKLVGGTREWWQGAAATAVGFPSDAEIAVEAIRQVAAEARGEYVDDEPQQAAPRLPSPKQPPAVTIGHRYGKRGRR
jgi:hypothetical protein